MKLNKKAERKANELRLADLSFKNATDFLENAISTATLKDGEKIEVNMIKEVLKALYYNARLCVPYKLEELKDDMLVYDDKEKIIYSICWVEHCDGYCVLGREKIGEEAYDGVRFEENRFYPVLTYKDLLVKDNEEE